MTLAAIYVRSRLDCIDHVSQDAGNRRGWLNIACVKIGVR